MRSATFIRSIVGLVMTLSVPASAQAGSGDAAFRNETRRALALLADAFGREQLLPIAMPQGHAPGDAYVFTSYWVLDSRAADCFQNLSVETFDWPSVASLRVADSSLEGRLSLLRTFNLDTRAEETVSVSVSFLGPQARIVSRTALRNALKRPDCEHLDDALAVRRVPVGGWGEARERLSEPSIVLHRVVVARRRIVLQLDADGGTTAGIQNPQQIIQALGLGADPRARLIDGEAAVRVTGSARRVVVIEDNEEVPVAFTPVALPKIHRDLALSAGAVPTEIEWIDAGQSGFAEAFDDALSAWRQRLEIQP